MTPDEVKTLTLHEVIMSVTLLLCFAGIVYLSVRRWRERGWLALVAAVPIGFIWLVAYVIIGFAGPWCSRSPMGC